MKKYVRVSLVCRLLEKLGWNIWKPTEVFTEYQAVRSEDASRVDIALFLPPELLRPAVFIEVKSVGKLLPVLDQKELQLWDYNRATQANISLLTDGQHWRFYLSGAPGKFSQRCFETLDLLAEESTLDDIELALDAFNKN